MRQSSLDFQKREERIIQLEEELKHKIQEVSRQLGNKEEEIHQIKKKQRDEKLQVDQERKRMQSQMDEMRSRLEIADKKFYAYKQEIEQSPLNVLRNELAQKSIEVVEMESKLAQAHEQRDEYKAKFEKVKKDMIALKKQIDEDKEKTLTRQA